MYAADTLPVQLQIFAKTRFHLTGSPPVSTTEKRLERDLRARLIKSQMECAGSFLFWKNAWRNTRLIHIVNANSSRFLVPIVLSFTFKIAVLASSPLSSLHVTHRTNAALHIISNSPALPSSSFHPPTSCPSPSSEKDEQ